LFVLLDQVFLGKVSGLPKVVSPDGNVVLKKALERVGGAKVGGHSQHTRMSLLFVLKTMVVSQNVGY
jgi:hypothetical protein